MIIVDNITEAYAIIPGYEMPPVLREQTSDEEEQGECHEVHIDTIQPRAIELHIEAEGSPRED